MRNTTTGRNQTLNRFIATRANIFYINHDVHAITRYMEDTAIEDEPNTSTQLTEFFFIKSEYVFNIDCTNKKFDNIIAIALKAISSTTLD